MRSWPEKLIPPLVSVGAACGLLVVARFWDRLPLKPPPCGLRTLTGIPCPACGGTRAFQALAAGDVLGALRFNPLAVLLVVGLLAWLAWAMMRLLRKESKEGAATLKQRTTPEGTSAPRSERRGRRWIPILVAMVVALNWIYLLIYLPE